MASQIDISSPRPPRSPVTHALGAGLHAALVADPAVLVGIPLLLYFPNVALEALQARFTSGLELEILEQPFLALALSLGWGFALVGRLLGQTLVIRRTAAWLTGSGPRPLGEEMAGVVSHFPSFAAVFLLFCLAMFAGFVFFALPGLLVLYLWGFAPQVAALEHAGILGSFRRSRAAVRRQTWRWLAGAFLSFGGLALVVLGAGLIWTGVVEGFRGDVPFGIYILAFAVMEFAAIVFGVVWTALYLDLEGLRAARETRPPTLTVTPPRTDEEGDRPAWLAG